MDGLLSAQLLTVLVLSVLQWLVQELLALLWLVPELLVLPWFVPELLERHSAKQLDPYWLADL
jgi:hypothetical protein